MKAIESWALHLAEIEKRRRELDGLRRGMPELGVEEKADQRDYWWLQGT